MLTATPGNRYY
jgi:hypothetical protein